MILVMGYTTCFNTSGRSPSRSWNEKWMVYWQYQLKVIIFSKIWDYVFPFTISTIMALRYLCVCVCCFHPKLFVFVVCCCCCIDLPFDWVMLGHVGTCWFTYGDYVTPAKLPNRRLVTRDVKAQGRCQHGWRLDVRRLKNVSTAALDSAVTGSNQP